MHIFYADKFEGTVRNATRASFAGLIKRIFFLFPYGRGDKIFLRLLDEKRLFRKLEYMGERLANAVLNGEKIKCG